MNRGGCGGGRGARPRAAGALAGVGNRTAADPPSASESASSAVASSPRSAASRVAPSASRAATLPSGRGGGLRPAGPAGCATAGRRRACSRGARRGPHREARAGPRRRARRSGHAAHPPRHARRAAPPRRGWRRGPAAAARSGSRPAGRRGAVTAQSTIVAAPVGSSSVSQQRVLGVGVHAVRGAHDGHAPAALHGQQRQLRDERRDLGQADLLAGALRAMRCRSG